MILLFLAESWSQEAGGSSPQISPFRFVPVLPCTHSSCLQLNTLCSLNSSEQHWVVDKHLFHSSQSRAAGYRQVWCNEFHSGPQGAFRWALLCPGCQSSWYQEGRENTALISSSPSLSRSGIPRNHTTPFSWDRIGEQGVPGILGGGSKKSAWVTSFLCILRKLTDLLSSPEYSPSQKLNISGDVYGPFLLLLPHSAFCSCGTWFWRKEAGVGQPGIATLSWQPRSLTTAFLPSRTCPATFCSCWYSETRRTARSHSALRSGQCSYHSWKGRWVGIEWLILLFICLFLPNSPLQDNMTCCQKKLRTSWYDK